MSRMYPADKVQPLYTELQKIEVELDGLIKKCPDEMYRVLFARLSSVKNVLDEFGKSLETQVDSSNHTPID